MNGYLRILHSGPFPEIFKGEVTEFSFTVSEFKFVFIKFHNFNGQWITVAGNNLIWMLTSNEEVEIQSKRKDV